MSALESVTTTDAALELFDSLPAVGLEEMIGAWRGTDVTTGHPLDGLLETYGWHGKTFVTADDVQPLVFAGGSGHYCANPAVVPMGLAVRYPRLVRTPVVVAVGRAALRLTATRRPQARLRTMTYRGVPTATMTYDALPIHDHFRRVGPDTLLGLMDLRGLEAPFAFALRSDPTRTTA